MATVMTLPEYKEHIAKTFMALLAIGDKKLAEYKASRDAIDQQRQSEIIALTERATKAEKALAELTAAYETQNRDLIDAKAIGAQEALSEVKNATTEVAQQFGVETAENPNVISDAAVTAIIENPNTDTAALENMEGIEAVNETAPTPPAVVEAAVEAAVKAIEVTAP